MTREGFKKWFDTEVFQHWLNGGEVLIWHAALGWTDIRGEVAWSEKENYTIKEDDGWIYTEPPMDGKWILRSYKATGEPVAVYRDLVEMRMFPVKWISFCKTLDEKELVPTKWKRL